MNVAIFSESSADEAAIRVLVDAIVGTRTNPVSLPKLRSRGWASVLRDLPVVYDSVYFHSDADALVVVIDSNGTTLHEQSHLVESRNPDCRFCILLEKYSKLLLRPKIPNRTPLRFAIGLAVPAIEAWLGCEEGSHRSETTWKQVMAGQSSRYDKQSLKRELYGDKRPGLQEASEIMVKLARARAANLQLLEQRFPGGFRPLVESLRQP